MIIDQLSNFSQGRKAIGSKVQGSGFRVLTANRRTAEYLNRRIKKEGFALLNPL
jgi:hypothetical protein